VEQKNVSVAGYLCMVKHSTLSLETLHFVLGLKDLCCHIRAEKGTVTNFLEHFLLELKNFYFQNLICRNSFMFAD
jgi:hypothetical protein